jgi:hypothetical protein
VNPFRWLWRVVFVDEPREPRPDEVVVLADAADAAGAGLWADILNRKGMRAVAVDAGYVGYGGMRIPRWRVLVKYGDRARARALLGLDDGEDGDEPPGDDDELP